MPRHLRRLILLYPLLLGALLGYPQQRRADTLILHFPFNVDRVQPRDSSILSETFASRKIDSVAIDGYTDKVGSVAYNLALSRRRAAAASQLLSGQAPEISRQHVAGHGIAPTADRSDSENRRVEIVLYYTTVVPRPDSVVTASAPARPPSVNAGGDSIEIIRHDADTAVVALRHINFIVDTPIPTDSTRKILPAYVEQLRQYKDRRFEIDGYVNSLVPLRGAKDPLYILSVRRAKFVYDYLIHAGFDPGKLSYKGMGNSSPVNPNPTTRKEMDANMRVEIKVY